MRSPLQAYSPAICAPQRVMDVVLRTHGSVQEIMAAMKRYRICSCLIFGCVCICLTVAVVVATRSHETKVLRWLRACPGLPDRRPRVIRLLIELDRYPDYDRWLEAGRRIDRAESILIRLYEAGRAPSDFHDKFVCTVLFDIGSQDSVPFLIRVLKDETKDTRARQISAAALAKIAGPAVIDLLRGFAIVGPESTSSKIPASLKISAIDALCFLRDPWVMPVLDESLRTLEVSELEREFLLQLKKTMEGELGVN